jgi:hypothetical protein
MKCQRCGEVNPAEIHTCTPRQLEQEPVAIVTSDFDGGNKSIKFLNDFAYMNLMQKTLLYTAPHEEGCAECGKKSSDGWALYCVKCIEAVQEPIGWIYEDDEGRMMFSQMPHPDPLWEPVYRKQK